MSCVWIEPSRNIPLLVQLFLWYFVLPELAREGMTMMVVTHEMGFARKVAHRVVFMDRGEIVVDTGKDDFFAAAGNERARLFLSKILGH